MEKVINSFSSPEITKKLLLIYSQDTDICTFSLPTLFFIPFIVELFPWVG